MKTKTLVHRVPFWLFAGLASFTAHAQINRGTSSLYNDPISDTRLDTIKIEMTNEASRSSVSPFALPSVIPPSPESVALSRYTDYPVSIATGVPEISIPIFTIKDGDITVPISISYHASGIKLTDGSGSIGLGWVLNAGGRISRTIVGERDELMAPSSIPDASTINPKTFAGWNQLKIAHTLKNTEFDIFSYSLLDMNGKFILNNTENQEVMPLMFNPVKISHTISGSNIERFDAIDAKGIEYRFGQSLNGDLATEYSAGLLSTWLVTDIRSRMNPGSAVRLLYQTGGIECQDVTSVVNPHYLADDRYDIATVQSNPSLFYIPYQYFYSGQTTGYSIQVIREIQFSGGRLVFTKNANNNLINKIVIYDANNNIVKQVLLKQSLFSQEMCRYRLDEVCFQDKMGNDISRYKFEYNTQYKMPNSGTFGVDFWGYYNGKTTNSDKVPTQSVYFWGNSGGGGGTQVIGGADRNAYEEFAKTYIMQKITYPTGGHSIYEFESNKDQVHGTVGGLRVKRINTYDPSSGKTETKEYDYGSGGRGLVNYKDLRYYCSEQLFWILQGSSGFLNLPQHPASVRRDFSGTLSIHLIPSDNYIQYSDVTEYHGTKLSNTGKTYYNYIVNLPPLPLSFPSNERSDICRSNMYFHEWKYWYPPLLYSKTDYSYTNNTYSPVYSQTISYYEKETGRIRGFHVDKFSQIPDDPSLNRFLDEPQYYYANYYLVSLVKRPSIVTDKYYVDGQVGVSKTINYSYDDPLHYFPTKETVTGSDGIQWNTLTKYPSDYPFQEPYRTMISKNMLEYPVESKLTKGSEFISLTRTNYASGVSANNTLIYPSTIEAQTKNQINTETRIYYHNYDSHGNLLYVSKDDADRVVYLWSYNYQYPVLEIKGATYDDVKRALGYTNDSQVESFAVTFPGDSQIEGMGATLRNYFSGKPVLVSTYTYKPLIGISSAIDPAGIKTTYEYDLFGRLVTVKDHNGKVINQYEYNYKQ